MKKEVIRDDELEYVLVAIPENNKVCIEDKKGKEIEVKYAVVFTAMDMREATGDEYEHPIHLSMELIPYEPVNSRLMEEAIRSVGMSPISPRDPFATVEILKDYMGGVPVPIEMFPDARTMFDNWYDTTKYINKRANGYASAISSMVGFILDRPVNRMGTTGWDLFNEVVFGTEEI